MARHINTLCAALALALLVGCASAASPAQNRVCGTTAQQNEQAKLDQAWRTLQTTVCDRMTITSKVNRNVEYYSIANINPEWPGSFIADWQSSVRATFQSLVESKLDPYQYALAEEVMNTETPWMRRNMSRACSDVHEEWWMFSDQGHSLINWALDAFPAVYTLPNGVPWQNQATLPIYDDITFNGLLAEMDALCTFYSARISGDWWTQAFNYVDARGGFIPDFAVYQQLDSIAFVISSTLNSTLGQNNILVDGLNLRQFPYTAQQLADLYAAMDTTSACASAYMTYTMNVALPLTVPVTNNAQWWALRDNGMRCDIEMAINIYNMTTDRAQYLFDFGRATLEPLVTATNASMYSLIPDYLGWNKTFIHASPTLSASFNVTFIGVTPADVTTLSKYSNSTVWREFQHACIQRVQEHYNLQYSTTTTAQFTLPIDNRINNGGGGYMQPYSGRPDRNLFTTTYVAVRPQQIRDRIVSVWNHEMAHFVQFTAAQTAACETCHSRSLSSFLSYAILDYVFSFWTYGYNFGTGNTVRAVTEGHATFIEWFVQTKEINWMNKAETTAESVSYTERLLGMLINMGYWAPNGWVDDTDCALYYQTHSSQPSASFNSFRNLCAARRVEPMWSGTALAYMSGAIYAQNMYERAKAACGAAFDRRYFISMHYAHGVQSLWVLDRMYNDYINSGCQKAVSERGDCWRNIAPPKPAI